MSHSDQPESIAASEADLSSVQAIADTPSDRLPVAKKKTVRAAAKKAPAKRRTTPKEKTEALPDVSPELESAPVETAAPVADGVSERPEHAEKFEGEPTAGEEVTGTDRSEESQDNAQRNRSGGRTNGRREASRSGRTRSDRQKNGRGRENADAPEAATYEASATDDTGEGDTAADSSKEDGGKPFKTRKQRFQERRDKERAREQAALDAAPIIEAEGIVEISPKGFGFVRERVRMYQQSPSDVFITPEVVRSFSLRDGLYVKCQAKQGVRGPQLIELLSINGKEPQFYAQLPYFEELTAINPNKKLTLETTPTRMTTRVIDLVAPIGRGQRGLIVAPPRTGKTTLLHHIAEGLLHNYEDELHLMVLLVDERPEEVTDFERSFPDVEVFSSSNDSDGKEHMRVALLAIERAKRLVEAGEHVVILLDSITRLARAFNNQMRGGGKRGTASGGITVGALEVPRRIFAAARNTREAGSLTIIATALIQTNSKADEAIFQEFKGTGNMELVLDRQIAQNYVYPAVDIHKSGTRREELLLAPHVLEKIFVIRRGLGGYRPQDAIEWLLRCMERYPTNAQMLLDIKTNAMS